MAKSTRFQGWVGRKLKKIWKIPKKVLAMIARMSIMTFVLIALFFSLNLGFGEIADFL